MKQAIVVVSFGTSVPAARESICAVEAVISAAAPERDFFRAFTSPTIRRILAGRGEVIPSCEDCLTQLAEAGYADVLLQPTHLLCGIEYDKLREETERWAGRFSRLTLGLPLLADTDDLRALSQALHQAYPAQPGEALVLLGHGTEHFANMVYPALQTALRLLGREDVLVGTVEGWPGCEEVLAQLQETAYRQVCLAPLMLVAGDHAVNDMMGGEDDSWRSRLTAAGYTVRGVMQGLGVLPAVQAMYAAHTETLCHGL